VTVAAKVPETMGSRAQEDFLVACRTIDPEYGTSGLRALIDLEDAGTAIPSVEDYVSKFTTYLKRVLPLSTGLSSMAAELNVSKPQQQNKDGNKDGSKTKPQCPCGLNHYWVDCWLINTEHPRRPKAYANATGRKKLEAALAADNDLRDKINKALDKWRAKQQENERSIAMDDGSRPTRPTANTVRYMIQDLEQPALDDDDDQVETRTVVHDDDMKPKGNLYTAVSMEEDIDKLSNRRILDPGSKQRRQSQPTSALTESQMGGEVTEQDKEQPNTVLLTLESLMQKQQDRRDDSLSTESEQRALDEQLAQEQQRRLCNDLKTCQQDLSATQIEGCIPDQHENNAPRRQNLDLSTKNVIEGLRRTQRNADLTAELNATKPQQHNKDIDKLGNQWILDPGSNTHVINTED
jgi:hypothetical protein